MYATIVLLLLAMAPDMARDDTPPYGEAKKKQPNEKPKKKPKPKPPKKGRPDPVRMPNDDDAPWK